MKYTAEQRAVVLEAQAIKNLPKQEMRRQARDRQKALGKANRGRQRDNTKLAWIRRLPCVAGLVRGGCSGPVEAAHVRFSDSKAGRVNPGMGRKSDDCWTTPLCRGHHQDDQHQHQEQAFWSGLGIDVNALCAALHAAYTAAQDGHSTIQNFARETNRG